MQARKKLLYKLLYLLQQRLDQQGHWQVSQPAPQAFESQEPFCVDSMTLQQWLRYIFVPRMQALLESPTQLPGECAITPQVEMQIETANLSEITEVTQAIDQLISEGKVPPTQLLRQA
ncbi:YqcC family protein [Marinospirillum perlucidum]|uniref:YqcC family protein n=1 Tax=Marinospirillum perlucidum TaxID=1982602 RepID=UPI000DF16D24|nr:YqcC family protein [Marinospirillum perlucidum]